ncbi:MAG: hypothetical protein WCG91_00075 [Candidatus Shapirobacteria bacterium]
MFKISKIKEWLWRYLPTEIFATSTVLLVTTLVYFSTHNRIFAAYIGAISENLSYYGFMAIRDLKKNKFTLTNFLKTFRNLIVEFGPSEILDTLVILPFCMYWFPVWIQNYSIGIVIGRFAANIVSYTLTIFSYESRKKLFKD